MRVVSCGLSDVGKKRSHNEDSYGCSDELGLYLVADGMGGHAAGEVASSTAMSVIFDFVSRALKKGDLTSPLEAGADLEHHHRMLVMAVHLANEAIRGMSGNRDTYSGMGTTITGALVWQDVAYIVHVGDSRAYLLRDGSLRALTDDHSWVQEQLKRKTITPEEAKSHRWRNVITRALGNQSELEVDAAKLPLQAGDRLLLCTDGLTSMVDESAVEKELLAADGGLADRCRNLVEMSNEAGGSDNITVVLLQVLPAEDDSPGAPQDAASPKERTSEPWNRAD